jgi:macrolide transport system ATP-binding/permease protein
MHLAAEAVVRDLRFELRQLRKSPAFTLTAVLTLALGICTSLTIFAFVDAALLKPLPYPDPSRLVGVYERVEVFPRSNLSYFDYLDWKRMNSVFASLSAYQGSGMTLTTPSGAERAPAARVSDDFFRTLGAAPILGRDFRQGEDLAAAPRVAILSYGAWQTRYGGRAGAVGSTVILDGDPHVIVGVMPRGFHFAPVGPADFWTTLHPSNGCDARRSCHNLFGVARLAEGVSAPTAAANIAAIARQLEQQYPDSNRGQGSAVVPLADVIVGDVRPVLLVLLTGAGLLLFIATVNVAGLLLVRSEARRKELDIRTALGASRSRVVAQFMTESVLLVSASTALALAAAWWSTRALLRLIPANMLARMPYFNDLGVNLRVAALVAGVALVTIAVLSSTPLVHLALTRGRSVLADRGSASAAWRRVGTKLVVLEIVTAMILLVGGGLLGKSLYRLLHVDIGLQPDHLATIAVSLPASTYATDEQQVVVVDELLRRVAALPGVESAAVTGRPPLQPGNTVWIRIAGRPYNGEHNEVFYREISPAYLSTLKARLARGRYFTAQDDASRPRVVMINQALARRYFANDDAIGRQLFYHSMSSSAMEVVGIVDDVKEGVLDASTPATMYVPFAQEPSSGFAIVARTSQEEQTVLPALAVAVRETNPGISTFAPRTMNDLVTQSQPVYLRRSSAALVGAFAVLAWLLGVVGLYGTVAYSVSQRTREIGIRLALGAQASVVRRLIVGEAAVLTAVGLAIGAAGAIAVATWMRGLLFAVSSWDASTIAAAAAVLGASAIAASHIPARRAARVDPNVALRAE